MECHFNEFLGSLSTQIQKYQSATEKAMGNGRAEYTFALPQTQPRASFIEDFAKVKK